MDLLRTHRPRAGSPLPGDDSDLASFLEQAPVGISTLDRNGVITWSNHRELALLGYADAELVGRNIRDFYVDPSVIDDILNRLTRGQTVDNVEARLRAKEGTVKYALISANVGRDRHTGDILYVSCFTHDITDRQRGEQPGERTEDELRASLQLMADVSRAFAESTFDLQKILDIITTRSMQLFGDMCGVRMLVDGGRNTVMQSSAHRDPEGQRLLQELSAIPSRADEGISGQVIVTGQPILMAALDVPAYRAKMDSVWTAYTDKFVPRSIIAVPLVVQGEILGSVLLVRHTPARPFTPRDLTLLCELTDRAAVALAAAREHQELQQERQRLRARTAELQAVMAAAPVAIWVAHDAACARITGNPESYRALRMNEGDNVSKSAPPGERPQSYRTVRDGRDVPPPELPLQLAARRGVEVRAVHFDIVFEDGTVRNMFGSALPLLGDDGAPRGSVGAFMDVTPLRDAIRARDEFLSIASHDLRTPLTSLELYVSGILRAAETNRLLDIPPERLKERLRKVNAQSKRLTSLIATLLDVSRVTSQRLLIEPEDVNLADLARDAAERFQDEAGASGSKLSLRLDPTVVGRWDRSRLDQVITNLISNAVKYGAGNPIRVVVARASDRALLTVEDRGIGIPDVEQAKIFSRFERASTAKHYGGIGLGLWIVKQIVDAHGGRVSLDSAVGRGSTFLVDLPLAAPPLEGSNQDAASQPSSS